MKHQLKIFLKKRNWFRLARAVVIAFLLIQIAYYAWQVNADYTPDRIIVYASSTQEEVLSHGIFPSFKKMWKVETGQDIEIEAIFGPSATLAGQIVLSAPADVALFSNSHHVNWLKLWRIVRRDTQPVMIGYTPLVIVTRVNNPYGITDYPDLATPGLYILHPDPRSSGAGEWALLAEYGSHLLVSNNADAARVQLKNIWHNVRLLAPSARATLTLFELGTGDALVTFEQDARIALERGVPLQIVFPNRTILAQHVAVTVDENVTMRERPVVEAFMDYLLSKEGQEIFNRYHLRSVNLKSDGFPPLSQSFTVEDLGGWSQAYRELFENFWHIEIEPRLELKQAPTLLEPRG